MKNDPERAAAAGRAGGGAESQTIRTKLGPVPGEGRERA